MERFDPLVDLLDEARAADAGAARTRQRWLERQAAEEATLVGTLLDLAEGGSPVTVRTTAGRTCHGPVVAVSDDFLVVRVPGRDHCVRLAAVASLRPRPGEGHVPAAGRRPAPLDLALAEVLGGLAPERPRVALVTAGGELLAGELLAAGADIVTLGRDGDHRSVVYVPVVALGEVVIERG